MFFSICLVALISYILFHAYINLKWRFYSGVLSPILMLRSHNVLSRVWPCDNGFASLKWSGARDVFFTIAFSALIYFINHSFLNSALLFLKLAFVVPKFYLYIIRVRDYNNASENSKEFLKPVKSACFSTALFALFTYIITLICYGVRP